jgi:soluble cytochrome b562
VADIPRQERLPSQIYAEYGKKWVSLNGAASLLEESKKSVFEEMVNAVVSKEEKISKTAAEGKVYSSPEWKDYVKKMVEARTLANKARIAMKYAEIRAQERNSEEAAARIERRIERA